MITPWDGADFAGAKLAALAAHPGVLAARAAAFLAGRGYVTPGDIKRVAHEVLRHRVVPTYEAEAEGIDSEELLRTIFDTVPVP